MDIPFASVMPHFTFPEWFNADNPCDEDAELTKLEQAHHCWLTTYTKRFTKTIPIEKPEPEPVEEAETEDDAGNEDAEESEDSHDVDEEEPAADIEQEQVTIDGDYILASHTID